MMTIILNFPNNSTKQYSMKKTPQSVSSLKEILQTLKTLINRSNYINVTCFVIIVKPFKL